VGSEQERVESGEDGIDFEEAKALWDSPARLPEQLDPVGEPRWALTALLDGKLWRAVWTVRGRAIRIISIRRASRKEAHGYGAQTQ
jgi:uncharacterized DUF497 family protein